MNPKESPKNRLKTAVGRIFHRRDVGISFHDATEPIKGIEIESFLADAREITSHQSFGEDDFKKFVQNIFQVLGTNDGTRSFLLEDPILYKKIRLMPQSDRVDGAEIRVTDEIFHLRNDEFIPQFFGEHQVPIVEESVMFRNSDEIGEPSPYIRYDYNIPPNCLDESAISYVTGERVSLPRDPNNHPTWITPLDKEGQPISIDTLRDFCRRVVALAEADKESDI